MLKNNNRYRSKNEETPLLAKKFKLNCWNNVANLLPQLLKCFENDRKHVWLLVMTFWPPPMWFMQQRSWFAASWTEFRTWMWDYGDDFDYRKKDIWEKTPVIFRIKKGCWASWVYGVTCQQSYELVKMLMSFFMIWSVRSMMAHTTVTEREIGQDVLHLVSRT